MVMLLSQIHAAVRVAKFNSAIDLSSVHKIKGFRLRAAVSGESEGLIKSLFELGFKDVLIEDGQATVTTVDNNDPSSEGWSTTSWI